jgi:hypothetical protein
MESPAAAAPLDPAESPPAPPQEEPAASVPLPDFRPSFGRRYVVAPFWAGLLGGAVFFWILALNLSCQKAGVIGEVRALPSFVIAFAPALGIALWLGYLGPVQSYATLFGRIAGALFYGILTAVCWLALLVVAFDAGNASEKTGFFVISLVGPLIAALALLRLYGLGAFRARRAKIAAATGAVLLVSTFPYSAALRCRLGFGDWCAAAAADLAARNDHLAAARYGARGCDADDAAACTMAGREHQRGQGLPRDLAKAEVFFRRGCALGDADACERVHGIELSKRCDHYSAFACRELAEAYTRGRGVDSDRNIAAQFYRKACLLGESAACGR